MYAGKSIKSINKVDNREFLTLTCILVTGILAIPKSNGVLQERDRRRQKLSECEHPEGCDPNH
jgi:hypothetical protein